MYRARRYEIARTRLVLEIGNQTQSISLPAIDLPYSSKNYRLHLNRAEAGLRLFESRFGAKQAWGAGVKLINVPLDMVIGLPFQYQYLSGKSTNCGSYYKHSITLRYKFLQITLRKVWK